MPVWAMVEGGGCLVATAAYGIKFASQVQALREYGDGTLMATGHGQAAMAAYSATHCVLAPRDRPKREHHAVRQAAEALAAQLICALRGGHVGCGDQTCRCSRTAHRAPACDRRVRRGSGRGDVGRPSDDRRAAAGRADARRLLRRRPARRCAGRAPSPAAATPDWTGRRQGLL